jgi:TfoX/Sxy family transcriptional regulator of competence genes
MDCGDAGWEGEPPAEPLVVNENRLSRSFALPGTACPPGKHMPYSRSLADRVRQILGKTRGVSEKKMFGGVGFLLGGNMLVGIWETSLIVRLGDAKETPEYAAALGEPNVREFDITGRPMRGWVMVEADGLDTDAQLRAWIERSQRFVAALPPK